MTTVPPVPRLDIDEQFKARGWRPSARHLVERQIAWHLLHNLLERFPDESISIYDGDEDVPCGRDPVAAMELIFNLDESLVRIGGRNWVLLICGNGTDMVSDYGVNPTVEAAVDATSEQVGIEWPPRTQNQ